MIYLLVPALFVAFSPLNASPRFWFVAGMIVLLVTTIHFFFSAYDTVGVVIRSLSAQPPDPQDDVHSMLINVIEEIHMATGNKRSIRCVVIPSLSMNAIAAADLKGEAVIGITEGLLSRLTRSQLEAVIAHEAHHILSGDCLETTVAASLFGTFTSAVEKLDDGKRNRALASPAFSLAWLLLKLTFLLNMFISREREYRADAASVRMTRNPIALAETLYLLSRSWRGAGFIRSGLEMLCIVNPEASALDEKEGFWADLLSTHPPLAKRMDVLLRMARVSLSDLEVRDAVDNAYAWTGTAGENGPSYYAMNPGHQWQGPFSQRELGALPWLSPLTWITRQKDQAADRAWKDPAVNALFAARVLEPERPLSGFLCPVCRQPLVVESYESTQIYQCRFCAGILVVTDRIPRIIARTGRDKPCSGRITSMAKTVVKDNQLRLARRKLTRTSQAAIFLLACPKCANPMYRGFYSLVHLIEIDRCSFCNLTWFNQDELAMLQCLIENGIVPGIGETGPNPSL